VKQRLSISAAQAHVGASLPFLPPCGNNHLASQVLPLAHKLAKVLEGSMLNFFQDMMMLSIIATTPTISLLFKNHYQVLFNYLPVEQLRSTCSQRLVSMIQYTTQL
jgi:hypothetical protein